jgi:hypothetical protein
MRYPVAGTLDLQAIILLITQRVIRRKIASLQQVDSQVVFVH